MPAFLLIGIPLVVAVLLIGILTLPDDKQEPSDGAPPPKKKTVKKRK